MDLPPCNVLSCRGNPDAPAFPEYNLGINYTSAMDVSAPHIVTFIRSSQQPVTVVFKIEDFRHDVSLSAHEGPPHHINAIPRARTAPGRSWCRRRQRLGSQGLVHAFRGLSHHPLRCVRRIHLSFWLKPVVPEIAGVTHSTQRIKMTPARFPALAYFCMCHRA